MKDAFDEWVAKEIRDIGGYEPKPPEEIRVSLAPPFQSTAYVTGVYILYLSGEVQYVGQSVNVYGRIAQHMQRAPFQFDAFRIEPCLADSLTSAEAKAIHDLSPRWNAVLPAWGDKPFRNRGHYAGE